MKRIEIIIDEKGMAHVEGHEFKGPECEKFLGEIEAALGVVGERRKKPEYNARVASRQQQIQGR